MRRRPAKAVGTSGRGLSGPLGSRMFVLGACASVGGIAGAIRGAADGVGLLKVLGLLSLGVLGVTLTVGCVVSYAGKR
ncbi:hypothetical protein [Streptomyces sp. NBC_01618]|uniref:hypothetical protein n=1 Tax=Streptomyces sp. NBC_01618 TaxID=2975900 RepID=UPI003863207A|nr:hypothetical protein OH735_14995 [Streptomyces sp. NBC_01618]